MQNNVIFWAGRSAGVARELYSGLFKAMGCTVDFSQTDYFFEHTEKWQSADFIFILSDENCVTDCARLRDKVPHLKIGLVDYRGKAHIRSHEIDFDVCLVNSIEKKLTFAQDFPGIPSFLLVEFPLLSRKVESDNKNSNKKNTVKIGYHGNIIHLNACFEIFCGLSAYAKLVNKQIDVILIYDIKGLGKWVIFDNIEFDNITFVHQQWSPSNLEAMLVDVDVGLCPNLIPELKLNLLEWIGKKAFLKSYDDIQLRFKAASNLGRSLLFFQYGKPILAEPTPSMVLAVGQNNERGQLVLGRNSVVEAMLALDKYTAKEYSVICYKFFEFYSPKNQFERLSKFLSNLETQSKTKIYSTNPEKLSQRKFWLTTLLFECRLLGRRIGKKIGFGT